jgi:hypothetical protein
VVHDGFVSDDPSARIAVLIDADNTSPRHASDLLEEIAKYGTPTVKRAYGDWTTQNLAGWKSELLKHAIQPQQQFAYTTGKNSTDSSLIIDAMDLLYTRNFDGFCLITSDSDFTGLAMRLREEGLRVHGFGERKTPAAFRNACHKFVFTEVLQSTASSDPLDTPRAARKPQAAKRTKSAENAAPALEFPKEFVLTALEQSIDDAGWAQVGTFGSYLTKLQPDFDSRLFGYRKLSDLVKAKTDLFVTEERQAPGSNQKVLYLRAR